MATTGWVLPTANTVEAGSGTWTNDTAIRTDDGTEATFSLAVKNATGRANQGQTFGFDSLIPSGSTIDSVEIRAEWRVNNAGGIATLNLRAYIGGAGIGTARTNTAEPTTLTTNSFDITADRSWTRADLLNGTFELRTWGSNGNSATDPSYRWDHIAAQIGYTLPSTTGTVAETQDNQTSTASGTVTGIVFQLEADTLSLSNNDPVATWTDLGGHDVTQGTSGAQPLYKTNVFGSLPAVLFDGTDDVLKVATPVAPVTDNFTVILVAKRTSGTAAPVMVGNDGANGWAFATSGAGGNPNIGWLRGGIQWHTTTTAPVTIPAVYMLERRSGTTTVYLNGTALSPTWTDAPSTPTAETRIGNHDKDESAAFFNGHIGAVFIAVGWTTTERDDFHSAVQAKWMAVSGSLAETQADQTSSASGTVGAGSGISGSLAETQDNQTSTASGVLEYAGTIAETQDNQTSSASGVLGYSGTVAETQDNQTSTASGILGYSGTLAETQDNQTSAASGQLGYSGTLAETQDNQTSTASGTFTPPGAISGTLAETQDNQTSTASGTLGYSGTLARTQANQTSTAAGTVVNPVTGTLAETQDNQTATAAGVLGYTGTLARTQANQTSTATGTVTGPITGTLAETQDNQTATASGTFVGIYVPDDNPIRLEYTESRHATHIENGHAAARDLDRHAIYQEQP